MTANLYQFKRDSDHYVNLNRIYGPSPRIYAHPQDDALQALADTLEAWIFRISAAPRVFLTQSVSRDSISSQFPS